MTQRIKAIIFSFIFLAIGVFVAIFSIDKDHFDFIYLLKDSEETKATVIEVKKTNVRKQKGSSSIERDVYQYTYQYIVEGKEYQEHSYGTEYESRNLSIGSSNIGELGVGDEVKIIYSKTNNDISNIKGLSMTSTGSAVFLVLLFPIVGVIVFIASLFGKVKFVKPKRYDFD